MKTEYPFGLDKNRRELSYYQSPEWMREISRFKKNFDYQRGERNSNNKIQAETVIFIRSFEKMPRALAKALATEFGIAIAYVYQLRKWQDGRYKKWPHLVKSRD